MWTLDYYRMYFDVSTKLVLQRMGKTLFEPEEQADLYGPFWVATTLVIVMAITGNFAAWLHFKPSLAEGIWRSDFEKVTLAASTFYTSLFVIPLALWGYFKRLGVTIPFVKLTAIYGYSFVVYTPAAILCVFRLELLRWLSVLIAFVISSQSVTMEVWSCTAALRDSNPTNKKQVMIALGCLLVAQAGIALVVKLYFFHYE